MVENPIVPNGFADHYPVFKWLFHWEYTLFSDKPIGENLGVGGGLWWIVADFFWGKLG